MQKDFDRIELSDDECLAELGLSREILREALEKGLFARTNTSSLHPTTFPGTSQWAYTVEALREMLLPQGWEQDNPSNLPVTIHPSQLFRIVVTTGNEDTGLIDGHPSNKSGKGTKMAQAIAINSRQLTLFPELAIEPAEGIFDMATWILMYHVDLTRKVLRSEISLPMGFHDTRITSWQKRIILDNIDLPDAFVAPVDQNNLIPPGSDIEVLIRKKG